MKNLKNRKKTKEKSSKIEISKISKKDENEDFNAKLAAESAKANKKALIITAIIVIVAIVGTFAMLKQNGLIGRSQLASANATASTTSSSTGGEIADKMPANSSNTVKGTMVQSDSKWITDAQYYQTNGTAQGTKVEIANKNKVSTVYAVSVGDGVVPVPQGFYYVGGNLATGVIISDNSADAYDGKTDKTTHSYASSLKGNQFVWIPCKASDYKKTAWTAKQSNNFWSYDVDDEGYEQCQKYGGFYIARYEAGVATLNSSGGWDQSVTFSSGSLINGATASSTDTNYTYISGWWWQNKKFTARGNYPIVSDWANKTNYATGNVVFKANSVPYYHADYYTACEMARRLYSGNNYVYCGLVTGAQWDTMVNKINSATSANIATDSGAWGNYYNNNFSSLTGYGTSVTGGPSGGVTNAFTKMRSTSANAYYLLTTGASSSFLKYGLYDVAGNLWEWTKEPIHQGSSTGTNTRDSGQDLYMLRGGDFGYASSDFPASYRHSDQVADTGTNSRFSFHTLHQVGLATFPKQDIRSA